MRKIDIFSTFVDKNGDNFSKGLFPGFSVGIFTFFRRFFRPSWQKVGAKKHKKRPAQKRVIFSKKLISERAVQLPEVSAADGKLLWCSLLR